MGDASRSSGGPGPLPSGLPEDPAYRALGFARCYSLVATSFEPGDVVAVAALSQTCRRWADASRLAFSILVDGLRDLEGSSDSESSPTSPSRR